MSIRIRSERSASWVVLGLVVTAFAAATFAAAPSGAIFTTTATGTTVNGNIYDSKDDVYLNGGPQNQNANGLPDGNYYFQVTDPSGAVLLSTDDITCREIVVANGRFAGATGPACKHLDGSYNPANESTSVKLMPYLDTPNNGGEYKVWLTPVANYSPNPATPQCSSNSNLTFGFCNADSKTDNFKVKTDSAAYVTVCKFNDIDNDGVQDANEPLIPHWPVTATGVDNGTVNSMTGDNGCVTFIYSGTGSTNVTLTEGSLGPDWTQTAPTSASEPFAVNNFVISVTLNPGDDLQAPNFGNNNLFCAEACDFDGLVVTKDAYPSLTRTFAWDIEKLVDQTEIKTSATSATFNYTVKVTHDAGTDSGWKVTGKIVVANPSGLDITGIDVTDAIDNESCQVDGGDNVTIAAGDHEDFEYTCTFTSAPTTGKNTATATWGGGATAIGEANYNFADATIAKVDDSVEVTDSLAGTLGTVTSADPSPKEFTYAKVVEGTTGTCTDVNNTATFTTNTTKTTGTDSQDVRLCVGADLTVSKTATPTFTRTYLWKISKSVNKTLVQQQGGSAIFNYTVKAEQSGVADSAWAVSGKVTVTNPNDWQDIVVDVTDAIDNGGSCTITGGGTAVNVPASQSVELDYTCTYAAAPSPAAGTNTATATWNAATSYTPTGTANGTAPVAFTTPTTTVNKTITVTDTFNGGTASTLGYVTATDAEPYASKTFTYPRTISNTTGGQCQAYDNTATITQTSQSDSETVTICNTATGGKTIGFWQNPNGQAIIKGGYASSGVCNSGTWLRGLLPFQDLSATATCSQVATYATNVIKAANASGTAMNAMLKAQMLATALDVYFSDPALGGNKIGAAQPIGGVKIDLTSVNKPIGSSSYENTSAAFGGASCRTVVQLLADAALQSNAGGSVWYGQVKATQELAKDTFDAINNQVAWIAPTCP